MAESTDAGKAKPGGVNFVIEMAGPLNQNFVCPYDRSRVRGRWQRDRNGGGQLGEELLRMPTIPGICFHVDVERRGVRRFDPLSQPQNDRAFKRIRGLHKSVLKTDVSAETPKVWTGLNPSEIKSFVLWCRRQLDLGFCEVLRGTLPEFPEIDRMPGDFIIGQFDVGGGDKTVKSKDYRYRKPAERSADDFTEEPVVSIDAEGGVEE